MRRRRRRDPLQLPPRPRPPAGPGARPSRTSTSSIAAASPAGRADDADRVPRGLALPGRLPAAGAGDDAWPRSSPRPAAASCTSPRPRSTPTSPTSSTAAARRSGRGRSAASSTRRATSRPTTTSREMSAGGRRRAFVERWERGRLPLRDHQLRQPGHGRPHREHPGRDRRRSRPSTPASARWSPRSHDRAAPAWSPPTTATPSSMLEPDGSPNTAHSLNPVPFDRHRRADRARPTAASSPTSRRPCSSCSESSSRRR